MTTSDKELLRMEILRLLAAHRDTEFKLPVIVARLCDRLPYVTFDENDVAESLSLFQGLDIVKCIPSQLYGLPRWQITQQGILFRDRNA